MKTTLYDFLKENQFEILKMTETKTLELAGIRPSSDLLKQGLPVFYQQLIKVLTLEKQTVDHSSKAKEKRAIAADKANEQEMAHAEGRPDEAAVSKEAGLHGEEYMRLGYTLSHVVHAYGSMCQSITELATKKKAPISADEFHDLNRTLDIAIAGAVTGFQQHQDTEDTKREIEHIGFLAHEMRNALMSVYVSLEMIKKGTVGFNGSTGQVLDKNLRRIQDLVDRSLTEVRLQVDPKIQSQPIEILQLVNQIIITAKEEARRKHQTIEINVERDLIINADYQLIYSALSNLIQNAIKFTPEKKNIEIRGSLKDDQVVIEVEDSCGGLPPNSAKELFKPYEQSHENKSGLGLGLAITKRAITLNKGSIGVHDLPGKGCVFTMKFDQFNDSKLFFHRNEQQSPWNNKQSSNQSDNRH